MSVLGGAAARGSGADALNHTCDHTQETLRWSGHSESVESAEREALIIGSPSWREATGVGAGLEERLGFYFRQMGPGGKWKHMSVLQKGVVYEVGCRRELSCMRRNSTLGGARRNAGLGRSSLAGEALVCVRQGMKVGK